MKTNHQRGYKTSVDSYGMMRKNGGTVKALANRDGAHTERMADIGWDSTFHGHQGYAEVVKGAKNFVHTRTRQDYRRLCYQELQALC